MTEQQQAIYTQQEKATIAIHIEHCKTRASQNVNARVSSSHVHNEQ